MVVVVVLGVVAALCWILCWIAAVVDLFRALRHPAQGVETMDLLNHLPRVLDINNFDESGHAHWRRCFNRFVIGLLFAGVTCALALLLVDPNT